MSINSPKTIEFRAENFAKLVNALKTGRKLDEPKVQELFFLCIYGIQNLGDNPTEFATSVLNGRRNALLLAIQKADSGIAIKNPNNDKQLFFQTRSEANRLRRVRNGNAKKQGTLRGDLAAIIEFASEIARNLGLGNMLIS